MSITTVASCSLLAGCTLLSNFDVQQCSADADCPTLEATISRCEQSRCVTGCRDNHGCVSFDPRTPICPVTGGTCSSLTSTGGECYASSAYDDTSMGALTGADMTLVGAFAPALRSPTWLSLELAVEEINDFRRSTDIGSTDNRSRPVLAVLCDADRRAVPEAMEHLIGALRARSVIASLDRESLTIAAALPSASQALLLSPDLVPLGDTAQRQAEPLLWYLGGLQRDLVAGYPALLGRALDALHATGLPAPELLSLVGPSEEDSDLADALESTLEVDGLSAVDLQAFDRYRRVTIADGSAEERQRALREIVAFAPRFVWVFMGAVTQTNALEQSSFVVDLDAALSAAGGSEPLYLFDPRSRDDLTLRAHAFASASFRARAAGIDVRRALDDAVSGAAAQRFARAFPSPNSDGVAWQLSAPIYDALYYLTYAADAAPRARLSSGEDVLQGLQRITDPEGQSVTVGPGPAGLEAATSYLAEGLSIDLAGTDGPANFESTEHARPASPRLWCWTETGAVLDLQDVDSLLMEPNAPPCAEELLRVP